MSVVEQATDTQLKNIQTKTGKTFAQLRAFIQKTGVTKHKELRELLQKELGLGYGDANMLILLAQKADQAKAGVTGDDLLAQIYSAKKADLRPIHDKLLAAIAKFGEFEIAPKKTYVSLRRKKQFAMIGPATNTRVEVGINLKSLKANPRLIEVPPPGMCQYKVNVTALDEVDKELLAWIKSAYDAAG
jgi:hypothetical protein